jgi:hypothetical protein
VRIWDPPLNVFLSRPALYRSESFHPKTFSGNLAERGFYERDI